MGKVRDQVAYIPMVRGFMYLVAVMEWATGRVLPWRLFNTLDTRFCVEALNEALFRYDSPETFSNDRGCRFTSAAFTSVHRTGSIKISMDGKGRSRVSIFVRRLRRTLNCERIYLKTYETRAERFQDMTYRFNYYNDDRKHTSLDKPAPNEAYFHGLENLKLAA